MKVVIVLPSYNEAKYIANVIKKIKNQKLDFIIIDDGSSDKTFEIVKKHTDNVLRHKINLGKGAALKTGCEFAFKKMNADAVIFMDSDDQHDSQELQYFVKELKKGSQLVFGVREFGRQMPLIRIMGNRLASYLVFLLFGKYIPDIPSGYKAMTKKVYKKINWQASDYGVELEIAVKTAKYKLEFSIVPISTIYHDMDRGMTLIDVFKMIFNMIIWRLSL